MKMLTTAGAFALALFTCSVAIADAEGDTATAVDDPRHFVQEWGAPIAKAALEKFNLA